jgi:hypothetical protein
MMRKTGSSLLLLPLLLATLFWALGHPLGRIILQTVHPFQLGATLAIGFCVFPGRHAPPALWPACGGTSPVAGWGPGCRPGLTSPLRPPRNAVWLLRCPLIAIHPSPPGT